MIGRKSIIGLCMLCALAISALAAQSASAVLTGTTGFTCKQVKGGETSEFGKGHCKKADTQHSTGGWNHVAIANDVTTELRGSNEKTPGEGKEPTVLKTTVAGTEIILTATGVEGVNNPRMHNHFQGEEHQATGEGKIRFTSVTVTNPAGCTVREAEGGTVGQVTTNQLKASTAGVGDAVKFEPNEGTSFASFFIEGGACPAIVKGKKEVFGSVISTSIDGATINYTHSNTTEQGTLRYGAATGPKAGISGLLTLEVRANDKEEYTPLSVTTTCKHECP
jgi:hypothetical protein